MLTLPSDGLSIPVSNKKKAYSYMWIELQKREEAKERIIFMNRMWVMQAIFEGLIFSFIITIVTLIDLIWILNVKLPCYEIVIIFTTLGLSAYLSAIEAKRYARTQIEEVILSYYSYCR